MLKFVKELFVVFFMSFPLSGILTAETADPLAPARQGYLECGTVDQVAKTCEEIAEYKPRADGKFDLVSQQVLGTDPQIVMTYKTLVFLKGDLICSGLVAADFDFATFTVAGKVVGSDQALFFRNQMRDSWLQIQDKTSCMKLVHREGQIFEEYYLDGIAVTDREPIKMQWIKAGDNFKLKGDP